MIHLECHLNEWNTVTVLINNILFFSISTSDEASTSGLSGFQVWTATLWTATTADTMSTLACRRHNFKEIEMTPQL